MSEGGVFTLLFDDVVADVGLVPAAVYGVVWRYCQRRDKECYASQTTLAQHVGISRQTLNTHLAALIAAGYITDTTPDREGQAHTYRLTDKRDGGALTVEDEPVNESDNQPEPVKAADTTCQADLHPPVKEVDTRNTSQEDKKERRDANASQARPVGVLVSAEERRVKAVRTAAREYFERETGLRIPKRGKGSTLGGEWWNPMQTICDLCDNDLDSAKHLISLALARMRKSDLTIANPRSILKTAIAIDAEGRRPAQGRDSAGDVIPRMKAWG